MVIYLLNSLGKLNNEIYEGYIEFECAKGHVWKVEYEKL